MSQLMWSEAGQPAGSARFGPRWRHEPIRSHALRYALTCLALAAVYFIAARLGLRLAFLNASTTAVWPPAGIALAALLLLGLRVWPAILAGAFFANLATTGAVATSLGIALGNTAEGLLGAYLVYRFAAGLRAFDRAATAIRFVALGALLSAALGATIGVATLETGGLAAGPYIAELWLTWWIGDAGGILVVAPLLILLAVRQPLQWDRYKVFEGVVLALTLAALGIATSMHPLRFLAVPFLMWAALRFTALEASIAALVFTISVLWGTLHGYNPLADMPPNELLLIVQTFIGVMQMMTLTVAGDTAERRRLQAALLSDRHALEEKVETDARELAHSEREARRTAALLLRAEQVAHTGSFRWDVPADQVTWSDELYRIFGRKHGEFQPSLESYLSCVHPDDREASRAVVDSALRDRAPFRLRHRIVRPGGEICILDTVSGLVADAAGRVIEIYGVSRDVTGEQHAASQLRDLAGRLISAQEEERSRLGRELHDHVSQRLGLLAIKVDELRTDSLQARPLDRRFDGLWQDIVNVAQEIRVVSRRLHSATLEQLGLLAAIQNLVTEFAEVHKIRVEFRAPERLAPLPDSVGLCLFRIAEESLHNVAKHSGVAAATVQLAVDGDALSLSIEDRGAGFDPDRMDGHAGLGFVSMRERLRLVHGAMRIQAAPGQGARIEARVPLHYAEAVTGVSEPLSDARTPMGPDLVRAILRNTREKDSA